MILFFPSSTAVLNFLLGKSVLVGLDYDNVHWKHQQVDKFLHQTGG